MKKLLPIIFILLFPFLFAACGRGESTLPNDVVEEQQEPEATPTPQPTPEPTPIPIEYFCDCGMFPAGYEINPATPPINMIISPTEEEIAQFATIHRHEYLQWEAGMYHQILFYTDEPLREFSFASLGFTWLFGPMVVFNGRMQYTVEEFAPGDAFLLNVIFAHYLWPFGGVTFINENGERQNYWLMESMAGGCQNRWILRSFEDRTIRETPQNSIDPTPEQVLILEGLVGSFTLSDPAPMYSYQDETVEFLYRRVIAERKPLFYHYGMWDTRELGGHTPFAHDLVSHPQQVDFNFQLILEENPAILFWHDISVTTDMHELLFAHSPRFDYTALLYRYGYDERGNPQYIVVNIS